MGTDEKMLTNRISAFVDGLFLGFSRHWLAWLNLATGIWVLLPWLAPLLMHFGMTEPAGWLYTFYGFQCHQLPQRSYFLFGDRLMLPLEDLLSVMPVNDPMLLRPFIGSPGMGWKVAWSDRMVSLYTPLFIGGLLYALSRKYWKPLSFRAWLLSSIPLAIDGTTHFINDVFGLGFRDNNAWLAALTGGALPEAFYAGDALGSFNWTMRLLTGLLMGFATVWFVYPRLQPAFAEVEGALPGTPDAHRQGEH